ncbi:MAG TPA: glycosyltransferase family 39 protein [Candidatus Baltobacteraceae bacterium]|nr:glycosyltransferase family 39 protein [Candidatus Baltobacteraceae bacterium]
MKRIPLIAAALTLVLHLIGNPHYGFFRDELYFIVCGFHPDWGYVDQPPLVPLLSAGSQLFGQSLFLLRAVAGLFAAAGVYVTCSFVIELGGGTFAQILTGLLTALLPLLDAFAAKMSTDTPGLLLWPLIALAIARIANGGTPRLWLLAGAAFGLAAEAKYTVLFYAVAMGIGLAASPWRRVFATPWFAAGAAVGLLIAAPSFVWQALHAWPFLALIHNQQSGEIVLYGPAQYVLQQVLITNPLLAAIWIFGIAYAFTKPQLRWIGWTYVLLVAAMIVFHGRNYYPGDVYPIVVAAAALAIERTVALRPARSAIVAVAVLASMLTLPFVLPGVAEARLAAVIAAAKGVVHVDMAPARDDEAPITQIFADMHGWPELTATVARVYDALPPRDRKRAAILASNYGEAAAIDLYGSPYGLPPAISGHNNYWIWGPRGYDGSVVVEVNGSCGPEFARRRVRVASFYDTWAMPTENGIPISICYGLKEPLAQYWPHLKRYI